jgi:hypothetical protein
MAGFSLVSLTALLGCDAPARAAATARAAVGARRRSTPPDAAQPVPYHSPYALSADCVLSEDYFQLDLANFDPATDKIIGYPRNDEFDVEAFIVKNSDGGSGALLQLWHGGPNGSWLISPIRDGNGDVVDVVDAVAGVTQYQDGDIDAQQIFIKTGADGENVTCSHLARDFYGNWGRTDLGWGADVGRLRINNDSSASALLAYASSPSTLYWASVALSANGDEAVTSGSVTGLAPYDPDVEPAISIKRDADGSFGGMVIYAAVRGHLALGVAASGSDGTYHFEQAGGGSGTLWLPPTGAAVAGIEDLFEFDYDLPPIAVVSDDTNTLWAVSLPHLFFDNGVTQTPTWTKLWQAGTASADDAPTVVIGSRTIAAEQTTTGSVADKALDLYVVSDRALSVVHQVVTGDATNDTLTPQFTPPFPLQLDVANATLPVNRGPGTGLILLNTDGSLESLSLQQLPADPTTGAAAGQAWVSAAIHLPADTQLEISTYRVQIGLVDDWGRPVSNAALQISCALPVPGLINGRSIRWGPPRSACRHPPPAR